MKRLIVVAMIAGIGVAALAMKSTTAAKEDATVRTTTQAEVNAVIDARLHGLLAQRLAEARARAERAASER